MTRVLIDLPEKQLKKLDEIAVSEHASRAAVVRTAIDAFLQKKRQTRMEDSFGLLKGIPLNALEVQKKLRDEW
ncbi:MAG: ribbon-helix-helix protein, CopG family [Alphaproteobacteria bacterium]